MADYQKMYRKLFQATTRAIELLQQAQQETEEIYISSDEPELQLVKQKDAPAQSGTSREALKPL